MKERCIRLFYSFRENMDEYELIEKLTEVARMSPSDSRDFTLRHQRGLKNRTDGVFSFWASVLTCVCSRLLKLVSLVRVCVCYN